MAHRYTQVFKYFKSNEYYVGWVERSEPQRMKMVGFAAALPTRINLKEAAEFSMI